jgi:hypothetical protein
MRSHPNNNLQIVALVLGTCMLKLLASCNQVPPRSPQQVVPPQRNATPYHQVR